MTTRSHTPRAAFKRTLALLALCCLPLAPVAAHAAPAVGTDNVAAIKENKRVAIDRFSVEFYTQLFGEGRSGRATARMTAELQGISDATRQAVTDAAYKDTVDALTKAGFEVVDQATVNAHPLQVALDAKYGKPSPWVVEDEKLMEGGKQVSQIVAPAGMRAYFQSGVGRGDFGQRVDSQNFSIGKQQGELAQALNATLLDVHVLASFGTVSATKNGLLRTFARSGAKAGIEAQPVLYPEETQIQIVNSGGARTFGTSRRLGHSGAVYLSEPLVAQANIFEMRDTQTSAEKDKQTASNFLMGMIGGTAERSGTAAVTASSEEAYRSTYQALIREAIDAMVAALAAGR